MTEHHPKTPRNQGDLSAPHMSPALPSEDSRTVLLNRIAWGAVFAGVVTSIATQLIINMIGVGIGAATLDPVAGDNPAASTFSISAAVWFGLAGIVAALVGGYTAGRLSGAPVNSTAGWHGVTTWALSTLVVVYLLTSTIGGLLGGAYRGLSGVLGGVAGTVGSTAQTAVQAVAPGLSQVSDPFSSVEQSVRTASGGNDPAALRDAAVAAMRAAVTGDPGQAQDARRQAAQALAKAQNISEDQALTRVQEYEQQYRHTVDIAKQKAAEAADAAAKATSRAALLGALSLLLGAIAGWVGGRMGTVKPTLTNPNLRNSGQF